MCKTHNIDLVREQKSGRGLIDFAFSIGSDMKCLVEIKPAYSAKLDHGISTQLPTYLQAQKKCYGIYVPIMFDSTEYGDEIKIIREKESQVNKIPNIEIVVVDIRAWKPDTASKTMKLDDFDRYQS